MKLVFLVLSFLVSTTVYCQKHIKMVSVEGGSFQMGSTNKVYPEEQPVHEVSVKSFYMSQYEIPYDDYFAFCKAAGYAEPTGQIGFPTTGVTWERAVMFCNWLSGRDGYDHAYIIDRDENKDYFSVKCNFEKNGYRLPTEAEWEYAARGGKRSKPSLYSGSNSPYIVAWFNENYAGLEHKSGELRPNELGIYDMSGNVEEWCWDYYNDKYYSKSPKVDPKGPETGEERVIRGGNRRNKSDFIMVSVRQHKPQKDKDSYLGFRVVRTKTD